MSRPFPPDPFFAHSWLGLCTAEAVRHGRAPILPVFGGLRAEPGAVGPHGGRAWRGWDCCCILWREHSASVHVLSSPRPQSQSVRVLLPSLPLFNQRNPLSLSAPRAPRCQKHPPSALLLLKCQSDCLLLPCTTSVPWITKFTLSAHCAKLTTS